MEEIVKPVFSLSYAELIYVCNNVHTSMTRDTTEFAAYGVTAAMITAFDAKIDAFEALPMDYEFEVASKTATFNKNKALEELYAVLRGLYTRGKLALGANNPDSDFFYIQDMTRLPDIELLGKSRSAARKSLEHAAALLTVGWTAAMQTDLEAKNDDLEEKIDAQKKAGNERRVAANDRAEKANELYELLVKYTEIGKTIWFGVDPAKYNEYIINPSSTPDLLPPEGFSYSMYDGIFLWEAAEGAMNYELEAKEPGSSAFILIYDGSNLYHLYRPPFGISEYRIRSVAPGMTPSVWSNKLIVDNSIPAPPTNLQVNLDGGTKRATLNWNMVQGAFRYKVYKSSVAPGLPPDTWTNIATVDATNCQTDPLPPAMRHYFQVTNFNGINESEPSNQVFVEIP